MKLLQNTSARLGAWIEQDVLSKSNQIYNDNHVSPFIGLAWTKHDLGVGATADAMYVQPWQPRERSEREPEWILKSTLFHSALLESRESQLFTETYSALVYSTRLDDNLIAEHWTKAGLRARLAPRITADLYPELRAHKNSRDWEWEDFGDIRAGTRLGYSFGSFSAAISASYGAMTIWGRDSTPWLAMLVIGGEI